MNGPALVLSFALFFSGCSSLFRPAPSADGVAYGVKTQTLHVFPCCGPLKMNDDRHFRVERVDVDTVLVNAGRRSAVLPLLYDHGLGQRGGEAAGWILKLVARDDGLWAITYVLPGAELAIRGGQWRYLSPAFDGYVDPEGFAHPRVLLHLSLVNLPAIDNLKPADLDIATRPLFPDHTKPAAKTPWDWRHPWN